ncbi:MAG TPA: methyl-accepting chemotaxis protein [Ramlibacter sp.]|uniref:methyl-accepting chemotaxis protein n=1 Tax=Ramlibacter sp. TaxID=1917967 RepID=UPI002BD1F349|nr:methyl-accepting chemotaxis protein [Ramlibacter sp.]HVZ43472.1 methyl-accepting chemotaxis protein [Ramlibacter sp.]
MQWFLDLTMRSKLLAGFGAMIAMLAVTAATAAFAIDRIQESQHDLVQHEFLSATGLLQIRSTQNRVRAQFLDLTLRTQRPQQEAIERQMRAEQARVAALLAQLETLNQGDAGFLARLGELKQAIRDYEQVRDRQIALIYDGKVSESRELSTGEQESRYERIISLATELGDDTLKTAQAAAARSQELAGNSLRAIVAVGVFALALAVGLAVYLHRIIVAPLLLVQGAARRIAAGDLGASLPRMPRRDELGMLAETFTEMIVNLRQTVGELRDGINVLASAASEITASTAQVAAGSSEAAVAVSQTTTTVEEVKQTAQVSAQKARYVSDIAQKSVQISQDGGKTVDDSVEGMRRIQQQVDQIARNIMRLAQQGHAIGDIIATVNDLAEQSNLLAVNAAIEAAKAGDQGRGFAVVAQEIKSLADQSKQATAQVRSILGDIQKATDNAVLASEQGARAVESGTQLSARLGESIRQLTDNISEAAQAATQIAASAQQQLAGMDQVALAMQNINQASSQNVASTRQAESAAQNLHELGQKLRQMVEKYAV